MADEIVILEEDMSSSPLYSKDLAPVPPEGRSWNVWNITALWVGMAVCIPTYLLASYMIKTGITWYGALIIIALANLVITIPMALNGHSGTRYGVPFPVIGRSAFGTVGIHIPSIARGLVACGWFGVQTWIGGLAFYEIWCAVIGPDSVAGLNMGKFIGFALFWLVNIFFIWRGTESIKWLETYSAPILIIMGLSLVGWGVISAGSMGTVLDKSAQLQNPAGTLIESDGKYKILLTPLKDIKGSIKAKEFQVTLQYDSKEKTLPWAEIPMNGQFTITSIAGFTAKKIVEQPVKLQYRLKKKTSDQYYLSSITTISLSENKNKSIWSEVWHYLIWLTAMVGFWATMSISIADITRYAKSQRDQVKGQFMGLPGTMLLYSFIGVFVTAAAALIFPGVLIGNDAPWDPVSLLGKFDSPVVVVISQFFMIIATLSTNIAANVIAPANAFSNAFPKRISFRAGGLITGVIGIIICPWWVIAKISSWLIFVSGLLGPVLGIMICDYFLIRNKEISLPELFKPEGIYSYSNGFNISAVIALVAGVFFAIIGFFVEPLAFLYKLSWFSGFLVSFVLYYFLMKKQETQ